MKKLTTFVLVATLFLGCNHQKETDDHLNIITVDKKEIVVVIDDKSFPWEIEQTDFSFAYTGNPIELSFVTDKDTTDFKVFPSDTIPISFVFNQQDTIKITAIGRVNPAHFDNSYIEKNTGKYQVFCPEVHELINIAVALTDIGKQDANMVNMESDYYEKVISHFDAYKSHAVIDSLNQHITEVFGNSSYNYYYNIRMNACMYSFENTNIVNRSPYNNLGFGRDNKLAELIPLFEDFAKESNFKDFYFNNADYYQSLIDTYYELVPIRKMWTWVEDRFPQRYESYKIYFSPLIGGAHSTQKLADNEFKETIMFIDAPIFRRQYTDQEKEAMLSRVVFTEIDHNYVNPTSDRFSEIQSIMEPLNCWNNGSQGYDNSYATFNEYMTWAIFTLYLFDNFDEDTFAKRNTIESNFMASRRGFVKFKEFNEFVLQWYISNANKPFEDLYTVVIEWIKENGCE